MGWHFISQANSVYKQTGDAVNTYHEITNLPIHTRHKDVTAIINSQKMAVGMGVVCYKHKILFLFEKYLP